MSFANEVQVMKSVKTESELKADNAVAAAANEAPAQPDFPPVAGKQEEASEAAPEPAKEAVEPTPAAEVKPAKEQKKWKIGDQVFTNEEDALKYAQDLHLSMVQQEAYQQGLIDAKPKEEPAKKPTIEDEVEAKLFENPKEALAQYKDYIVATVKDDIKAEAKAEASRREVWTNFYESNADLAESRELVEFVLQKNWKELGNLPYEKSLNLLAEKTRAVLTSYKEAKLPSKELQSGTVQTTGASTPPTTVVLKKPDPTLDFISQLNKHRRRTATLVRG